VGEVSSTGRGADRFRCEPYAAVLRAAVCVERQRLHGAAFQVGSWGGLEYDRPAKGSKRQGRANFGKCGNCELGRRVLAKLEAVAETEPPPSTLRSVGVPKVEG